MKSSLSQVVSIDYTPDTISPTRTNLPLPRVNKSKTYISQKPQYVELLVPFNNFSDVTLKVYHVKKGGNPNLFSDYKRSRTVDSLLLEGSTATLFTYQVTGLNQECINHVNAIDPYDITRRLKLIKELGGDINFYDLKNNLFAGNLEIIGIKIHVILAECLLFFYRDNISSCKELINKVVLLDPLSKDPKSLYTINKKKFLVALVVGFKPNNIWYGHYNIAEAYQVLYRSTGDEFIFHLIDKYNFHNNLLSNTRFDFVDPVKVGFGNIYSKDNKSLIDLCLQVSLI